MDEAVQVQLHLQRGVPLLEGKHRAPVQPEIAAQEFTPEHLVDALVLHVFAGGQEEFDDLFLRLLAEREEAVGMRILTALDGGALQRRIWIVLVEPIELVKHAGALDLQRRDGPVQIPQAFKVVFHLASTANHEPFFRILDAVQRTAGQLLLLQDGDLLARHLAVADQEGRARQCRQAGADKPGRFVLYALGFARAGECFVIAIAVVHETSFFMNLNLRLSTAPRCCLRFMQPRWESQRRTGGKVWGFWKLQLARQSPKGLFGSAHFPVC